MSQNTRKLAAIMFTDIKGYTALMGQSEKKAIDLLQTNRRVMKPLIKKFNGQWVKEIGDGVMASFDTVSDAVYCAAAIQRASQAYPDLNLRIGIHQGEVIVQGDDVFGDGVNIASRLEPLAPEGGILVSQSVHNNIQNKIGVTSDFAGEVQLKNVKHPVGTYLISIAESALDDILSADHVRKPKSPANKKLIWGGIAAVILVLAGYVLYSGISNQNANQEITTPAPDDRIAIAVLPFQNYSGDPELEPFCDGMTDAVISRLSKIHALDKIVSRTSVMQYKNTLKSIPELAKLLGVTHILEGSFQKSDDSVKINLQLIDGATDDHFWSEDFQDQWGNIFKIQADVAEKVANGLNTQVTDAEIISIQEPPTDNTEAYNFFVKADYQRSKQTKEAFKKAIPLYEKAIEIDPEYTRAIVELSQVWLQSGLLWGIEKEQKSWDKARSLLLRASQLDPNRSDLQLYLHEGLFYYEWDFKAAENYTQNALNEEMVNSAFPVFIDYLIKTGRFERPLEIVNQRIQDDPSFGPNYFFKAEVLLLQGRKQEAIDLLAESDPLYGDNLWYVRSASKLYYYLDKKEKFEYFLTKLMADFPDRPPIVLWLNAMYYQQQGKQEEVSKYLDMLHAMYEEGTSGSPGWFIALYHAANEDIDATFDWLQKSYEQREVEMTWLGSEPLLIPFRDDPRYQDLYRNVGFADLSLDSL